MAHNIVKPQVLADAAVQLVEADLAIANLFTKKSALDFAGAEDDTLSMTVPGVLPFRRYGWRNDRSAPIVLDEYKDRKINVSFGGNVYSGSPLTDEQNDFDTTARGSLRERLVASQARAVGRGLEAGATEELEDGDYEVIIGTEGASGTAISRALVEARRVLNRFHAPRQGRVLVVGSDFDAALQNAELFNLAHNVGEVNASAALKEAIIGRWKEFTIVHSAEIQSDAAYALSAGGFVFLNAGPSVPRSVGYGATASYNDIAIRVMEDYDFMNLQDRLVTNTYAGFDQVKDPLVYFTDERVDDLPQERVTDEQYFVRGLKLGIDIESKYPAADSELAKATGVTEPKDV